MSRAFQAGFAYFVLLFGLGFLLGILRQILVQHGMGRDLLVLLEIPLLLAYAWWVTGWAARRFGVATSNVARIIMGGAMFALLRLSELLIGMALTGTGIMSQLFPAISLMGATELAAQIACAFFPLLHARLRE
jgi:hypothetical protein